MVAKWIKKLVTLIFMRGNQNTQDCLSAFLNGENIRPGGDGLGIETRKGVSQIKNFGQKFEIHNMLLT